MADVTTSTTAQAMGKASVAVDMALVRKIFTFLGVANEEGRRYLWLAIFIPLGGYALACFFHYMGWMFLNLLLSVVAASTLFVYGFQPMSIGVAVIGGLGYAAADDAVDWDDGVKRGVEALGRLVNAAIFFSVVTFGFYGTYPFDVLNGAYGYLALLVAAVAAVTLIIYRRISTGAWLQTIVGIYIAVVIIAVLLGGIDLVRETARNAVDRITQPGEAPSVQRVTWVSGVTYPLNGGVMFEGALPTAGATFDQPSRHCVNAQAIGGGEADYVPAGHVDNPWDRVLTVPKPSDAGKMFKVWAAPC